MTERMMRVVAGELRRAFDDSFARARPEEPPPQLDLLVIRVGDHRYALRLSEVAALHEGRKLTPAPSRRRELLGLVGLRGLVAPVYDLSLLLGYEPSAAPRWLAQVRGPAPFAVAFEHFEQHVRVPAGELAPATPVPGEAPKYASGSVRTVDGPVTVLDLLTIVQGSGRDGQSESASIRREER